MRRTAMVLVVAGLILGAASPAGAAGDTIKVSVSPSGAHGNSSSQEAQVAANGRYVAFRSAATNLVPGDTNNRHDVFVRDLVTGAVERVSVSSTGAQQYDYATAPAISADGRYVAFGSGDASIVPGAQAGGIYRHDRLTGETIQVAELPSQSLSRPEISADGNVIAYTRVLTDYCDPYTSYCSWDHVFVRDVSAGVTELASVSSSGERAKGAHAQRPAISGDGRFVAFESAAWNLAPGEAFSTDPTNDIFVRDRVAGTTTRVSRTPTGAPPSHHSLYAAISDDGSTVAYTSWASDIVSGDTNHRADVFTVRRDSLATTRASLLPGGGEPNGDSERPDLSSDGRIVAFETLASNLIPLDQNNRRDVVVRDLVTGAISFGTRYDGEGQPNADSRRPSVSADGRLTVYDSYATDILQNDSNFWDDVYVLIAYPWKTGRAYGIGVTPPGFMFADTGSIRRSAPASHEGGWQEISQPGVRARIPAGSVVISMDDVRSAASVAQADVAPAGVPLTVRVEGARASAQAACGTSSGTSSVGRVEVNGAAVVDIPLAAAPNTVLPLPNGGSVTLNEQVPQPGGVLVHAVRVTANGATVTFASALATIDGCRE